MAILTFPSITPEIQNFGIRYNTQVSSSTISGITNTVELPGARWLGNLSFRDLTSTDLATVKAFLMELRGSAGRFFYGDVAHTNPFNAVTGSPTINGSNSTPRIIRITLGSSSPALSAGDYIQIGSDDDRELKLIISSTGVGGDTYDLVIEPMIRRTDYASKPVVYANPKGVFLLTSSDQANWSSRSKALLSDINFSFIEVFT